MRTLASRSFIRVGALMAAVALLNPGALRAAEDGKTSGEAGQQTVRVAAVQAKRRMVDWHIRDRAEFRAAVDKNLTELEQIVHKAGKQGCDVLAFPEDTLGLLNWYGVNEQLAKDVVPEAVSRMLDRLGRAAATHRMYLVVCSDFVESDGETYNTAFLLGRDGHPIGRYHKTCPTWSECGARSRGASLPVFPTPDLGTVGMLICYDLVFPETARCLALAGADIIFFPTMGGAAVGDDDIGLQALRVRAAENHVYLVVAFRGGGSMIISPRGKIIARAEGPDGLAVADIDPLDGRQGGDAMNFQRDMRARLFRERNPAAFGILTDPNPPILEKVPIEITQQAAGQIAARVLTIGEEQFQQAESLARAGETERAITAFERLRTEYPGSWIDRVAKERIETLRIAQKLTDLAITKALGQPLLGPKPTRPNVVLILSDDQAWTDYGFMGHPAIQTPHLDKLARRSLLFDRGYVASPLCRPSLASILTGLYPFQHGITGNDVDGHNNRAALDVPLRSAFHHHPSFIKALTANGYLAHQSGKWWEGSFKDGGFTHGMTHGDPHRGGRHGDAGLKIGREGMKPVTDFIDFAVEEKKPFFVWYAPFLPHTPHNPPQRLLEKYSKDGRANDVARYYAMCEWFDETCGELLDYLDKKKITDNTLVLYICDNGWAAASTNADDPNQQLWKGYAQRSKGSPYENGIRTPIMVSWMSRVKPERINDLAHAIDFFPTIAAATGVEAPADLPGINLLDANARKGRNQVFGVAHSIHNMTVGDPDDTQQYLWCVEDEWKLLVRYHGKDTTKYRNVHVWDKAAFRLFNLKDDPHETKDLAGKRPEIVEQLKKAIEAWHAKRTAVKQQPES